MEVFTTRLQSFTKPRRVKHATAKRTLSLKWPHPSHFIATPDTLTEAGFFFNPSWDARDNVECYLCGKSLDGWDEQDDPFAIHWDKCKDRCAWAVVRCGIPEDIDRKGNFAFKDPTREPDGNAMKKARLATFKVNDSWPHDRVKGHGAHSTKMAKAGFVFTPQTPDDDTGTCLYCGVSLSGWDEDDSPSEEHQKRVKKSNLPCPFFPQVSAPKQKSKTQTSRSNTRPKSRAGSKQPQPAPSDTSSSHSDDDSQPEPAPRRQPKRSRTTSMMSAAKEKDTSDALRRSTRSRAKPPAEVEDNSSGTELRRSTSGRGRSKSLAKAKGKEPIEVIEEADEDDAPRAALPKKQRVKGKENVAQDVKVGKPSRKTKTLRANDTDEESRQPKREHPKKGKAVVDEKNESTSGVDSEKDVQPVVKRRNIVRSTSSVEDMSGPSQDAQTGVMDVDSDVASVPGAPSPGTRDVKPADVPTPFSDDEAPADVLEIASPTPPARPARSPQRPTPKSLPREESPATPPPASSSLLSVSSATSTTRVDSHTDAETLVEPLPLQTNGAQLTEEERLMTVEEWIRREIEVHYERLRRDGEMKIKLFKERAEEVRRQIESL